MDFELGLSSGFSGRTIWIADAHRDGKRFIVHADEKVDRVSRTGIHDSHFLRNLALDFTHYPSERPEMAP